MESERKKGKFIEKKNELSAIYLDKEVTNRPFEWFASLPPSIVGKR